MKIRRSSVFLRDVRFYAYHGVMEQERKVGGEFTVSVSVDTDLTAAVSHDDLATTLNYAALYEVVKREMQIASELLEHVAGRIGWAVLEQFPQVTAVSVRLTKLNPPMGADCRGAGVELMLER